jgi:ligand-binding SRPBCC domain-containing protein
VTVELELVTAIAAAPQRCFASLDIDVHVGSMTLKGPFARFRHEHIFEPTDYGTRMIDSVSFDAPAAPSATW